MLKECCNAFLFKKNFFITVYFLTTAQSNFLSAVQRLMTLLLIKIS